MKLHSANYLNTLIEVAEDCPAKKAEIPPQRAAPTIASIHFELLRDHPYVHTSDDVIFHTYATKNDLKKTALAEERQKFFSKGQACLRFSPLPKRYGWGIHCDADGKVALVPAESAAYARFLKDKDLPKVKAMRSKKGATA